MGEAKQKLTATAKLIAQFPRCALCGGDRASVTREHMPPKALFDKSHRPDKLVMPSCKECNGGTSKADLTAAMVSRWKYYSSPQERDDHTKLSRQVRIQAPELLREWTSLGPVDKAGALQNLRVHGVNVPDDAGAAAIGKLTIRQLNIFAHKATLCLYFENLKQPVPNHGRVSAYWRTKEDFAKDGVPQFFSSYFQSIPSWCRGNGTRQNNLTIASRSTELTGYSAASESSEPDSI